MITQQIIVTRVNQLSLRRNLTWYDISMDADNAIHRINSFLGANYPLLSDVFASQEYYAIPQYTHNAYPESYVFDPDTVKQRTTYVEIFPDKYFHSVVIPFIAMEVLSRDEEFTTIYNKYAQDLDNGLFDMFQNEFNRVPLVFRQNPDAGVFFASKSWGAGARVRHNQEKDLPQFKFRVYYHVAYNLPLSESPVDVTDTTAYNYGEDATIKAYPIEIGDDIISADGTHAYKFKGWFRKKSTNEDVVVGPGEVIKVFSDIHIYGGWEKVDTLTVDHEGVVRIIDKYITRIKTLLLPTYYNGIQIRTIPTYFLRKVTNPDEYATQLTYIELPGLLTTLEYESLRGYKGTTIKLPETPVSYFTPAYPGLTIGAHAFKDTQLETIILPLNVVAIGTYAFEPTKPMRIFARTLEINKPDDWNSNWYGPDEDAKITWGYNG